MKRVLVIYKKTTLQRYGENDPTIKDLLARQDPSVAILMEAHEAHLSSLSRAKEALRALGVKATFRHRHDGGSEAWDLVVTLGGDGTLLWASHQVDDQTPMVAINSAPTSSVGYFCAGDGDDVAAILESALSGKLRGTKLTRMRVEVDGEEHSGRVLNDILFCHRVPAATTRYIIHHGDDQESHTSSGVWAGPAAGSTAAQRSAGGKILPIGSRKIQWVVREPYRPDDMPLALSRGLVAPGEDLILKSKTRNGRMYMDGAQRVVDVDIGQEIRLSRSSESLTLLGLRSRGR
ncbi:MAG: NAD+ kinase [Polyangiales bacterium]|jgi:NAD+ kinase